MVSIPLFKSHYSRSILTLSKADSSSAGEPDSIIDICKENGLKDLFLVEDNMSGFLEAYKNSKAEKINLHFGVRLTVTSDMDKKDEESLSTNYKVVIMMKDTAGYKKLVSLYTKAATDGFYYVPMIDCKTLGAMWDDSLLLAIPFYDSFIFKNTMSFSNCVPCLEFTKPFFFIENNDLPFDSIIKSAIENFDKENKYEKIPAKTIYYKKREDFKAYLTFRCIHNRSNLNKPQFEHLSSAEFCFESWKEQNAN